ncbi:lipoprotein [Archangium gephyra]|nr:lipoprotein [Archangium gephyra]
MHLFSSALSRRIGRVPPLAMLLVLAAGCPGGDQKTLSGTVTYDFVPATYSAATDTGTLAFNQAARRPVRNAVVQLRHGLSVIATTNTDEQGNYRLVYTLEDDSGALSVEVLAKTTSPQIQVEDNTDGNAVWAIGTKLDTGDTGTTLNLHAGHGWTGNAYDAQRRTAAPFAVLDSMYTAAKAFMAVRPVTFPALKVNWSPDNVPQGGDKSGGFIGTSHFSRLENEIYILGKAGADTDEFDSHVIVHEWGHYFESNLSRSDSPGGPHGRGDILDPRIAFGEGYGNAIAAILLPESLYVDTVWGGEGGTLTAFGIDAETEPLDTDDPNPGVFSETSVHRLLYDLYDSGTRESSYDNVSIGLGTLYDVLVKEQKSTPAMTTIASFITALKAQPGVDEDAVDRLLARYNMGPITSAWGDGDTDMAGMYVGVSKLPFNVSGSLEGGLEFNTRGQNQYFVFVGNGSRISASANASYDIFIELYQRGELLGSADNTTLGTESLSITTQTGELYILVLTGLKETEGEYPVTLSITSP